MSVLTAAFVIIVAILITGIALVDREQQGSKVFTEDLFFTDLFEEIIRNENENENAGNGSEDMNNKSTNDTGRLDNEDDDDHHGGEGSPDDGVSPNEGDMSTADESRNDNILIFTTIIVVILILISMVITVVVKGRHRRERVFRGMRRDIYEYIKYNPGEHLSSIMYEFDTSPSTITYHLGVLEKGGELISHKDTKFKRYYAKVGGIFGGDELRDCIGGLEYKSIVSVLKNPTAVTIVDHILCNPGCSQKDIAGTMGINPSTVHWHMKRLQDNNIVEFSKNGRSNCYNLMDPKMVERTINVLYRNGAMVSEEVAG